MQNSERRRNDEGIKTTIFDSKLPHQFVACMWTYRRRGKLAKRAAEFEGALVLGCDATMETVRDSIGSTDCRVINGTANEGIMIVQPGVSSPFNISLELQGMTPVITKASEQKQV